MDIQHSIDQMEALMRDLAPAYHNYFKFLVAAGFNEEQALKMVLGWQNSMISAVFRGK